MIRIERLKGARYGGFGFDTEVSVDEFFGKVNLQRVKAPRLTHKTSMEIRLRLKHQFYKLPILYQFSYIIILCLFYDNLRLNYRSFLIYFHYSIIREYK